MGYRIYEKGRELIKNELTNEKAQATLLQKSCAKPISHFWRAARTPPPPPPEEVIHTTYLSAMSATQKKSPHHASPPVIFEARRLDPAPRTSTRSTTEIAQSAFSLPVGRVPVPGETELA